MENDDFIKCPENVPEEQKGLTEEEREWSTKKPPQPRVPGYVFIVIALAVIVAFSGGGWWYYRTNVLPEKYFMRAKTLMEQGDYAEAESLYVRILRLRPERRDVFYNIAYCREMTNMHDDAIKFYKKHLETDRNDAKAMGRIGMLYMKAGDYNNALKWLRKGSDRDKKNPDLWRKTADAAKRAGSEDIAAASLERFALLTKDPAVLTTVGDELMELKDYRRALDVFNAAAKSASADERIARGIIAAKTVLGLPTEERFTAVPGKSLGLIRLDASPQDVKDAMGRGPERKIFTTVAGKSDKDTRHVEVWIFDDNDPQLRTAVIFSDGKATEIETPSPLYRTEKGLATDNFLSEENKGNFGTEKAENGAVIYPVKGGGATFIAYEPNEAGSEAAIKILRVHRGGKCIDNDDSFSLINKMR